MVHLCIYGARIIAHAVCLCIEIHEIGCTNLAWCWSRDKANLKGEFVDAPGDSYSAEGG